MNILQFLRNKLIPPRTPVTPAEVKQLVATKDNSELFKAYGITNDALRQVIADQNLIIYERASVYQVVDRAMNHALMSASCVAFADCATIRSPLHGSTVWVTSDSKEYRYQLEKMLDVINIEEVIYDWAWTCLRGDTRILLIDGTSPTIKEMADNPKQYIGKKIWSINSSTKNLEVDHIVNAFKTKTAKLVRVTLDDGSYVDCTPEHKFMLRDGGFAEAQTLVAGTSLMPLYTKPFRGNFKVYSPGSRTWHYPVELVLTKDFLTECYTNHHLSITAISEMVGCNTSTVYDYLKKHSIAILGSSVLNKGKVAYNSLSHIFTKDILEELYLNQKLTTYQIAEKFNTSGKTVGIYLHKFNIPMRPSKYSFQDTIISPLINAIRRSREGLAWRKQIFERDNYTCQECGARGGKLAAHHKHPMSVLFQDFLQHYSQFSPIEDKETLLRLSYSWAPFWDLSNGQTLCKHCHEATKKDTDTIINNHKKGYLNHKVASVIDLNITEDVYDLSIEKNHNFPTDAGVFVHNCAAFGDMFVEIFSEPGVGIVCINDDNHPLNVSRVDHNGRLTGFFSTPLGYATTDTRKLLAPWDYVHFRLLGAKKRRPMYQDQQYSEFRTVSIMTPDARRLTSKYGTSILADALPIWKRLRLAEDSIMMARIMKSPQRFLFKVVIPDDNSNAEAVANLVDQYQAEIKRARAMNLDTNNPNYLDRFNAMAGCFTGNTQISLLNGTNPTIQEISENTEKYIGKYVYSVNPNTGAIEPDKILAATKTRLNAELIRVHLDNEQHIDCTPDHRFMLRDGTYKEAKDLIPNESLMPLYTKLSQGKRYPGYELIRDVKNLGSCNLGLWKGTHQLVAYIALQEEYQRKYAELVLTGKETHLVVHHKDFNKRNNDPSNLQWMGDQEHWLYHASLGGQFTSKHRGETYEQMYGKEKATEIRKKQSNNSASKNRMGKTYEEIVGKDGAIEWRDSVAKGHIGVKYPNRKSIIPTPEHIANTQKGIEARPTIELVCPHCEKIFIGKSMFNISGHIAQCHKNPKNAYKYEIRKCQCSEDCFETFECRKDSTQKFVNQEHYWRAKVGTTRVLIANNHKVVRVEYLPTCEDVYDITTEKNHNFALSVGVFVHNCEDLIFPVWGQADNLTVETLGGECLRGDVKIRMLDGSTPTIKEMTDNKDKYIGKDIYACNKEGEVVGRRIKNVLMTRPNTDFVRVHIDNGEHFDVTPDHPCMLRNGEFKHAELLTPGESLMPLYTQLSENKKTLGYEETYIPKTGKYKLTHRIVAADLLKEEHDRKYKELVETGIEKYLVIHHKDLNKHNNDVSNLQWMGEQEHFRLHAMLIEQLNIKREGKTYEEIFGEDHAAKMREQKSEWLTNKNNERWGAMTKEERSQWWDDTLRLTRNEVKHKPDCDCNYCKASSGELKTFDIVKDRTCKHCGKEFKDTKSAVFMNHTRWCDLNPNNIKQEPVFLNHKVVRVERLNIKEDAYDLVIEGAYDKHGGPEHCFALACGVFVHNTDIRWIADIDKLEDQLITALKVPKQLLAGYSGEGGGGFEGGTALERMDIRFARQARRVQRSLISGLTRMAQIHLASQGLDPDLNLFQIHMEETSSAEEVELQDALGKSVEATRGLYDMLVDMVGVDLDKKELLRYFNEKFFKLSDLDIESLYLKGDAAAIQGDPRDLPAPGEPGMAGAGGEGGETGEELLPPAEGEEQEGEGAGTVPGEGGEAAGVTPNPFRESLRISDLNSPLPNHKSGKLWESQWSQIPVNIQQTNG
jgi:intein/homing endonuclease